MANQDYTWKKAFYEDRFNPAIPLIKKKCQWIIMHYPDFSFTYGIKRMIINLAMIFTVSAVIMHFLVTGADILETIIVIILASTIASLLFLKTVAASVLWGVEQYQAVLKMASFSDIECNRCGLCCRDCQYLIRVSPDGLTACTIYEKRLGTEIAPGVHCDLRKNRPWDFPGCPYNTGKPLFTETFK